MNKEISPIKCPYCGGVKMFPVATLPIQWTCEHCGQQFHAGIVIKNSPQETITAQSKLIAVLERENARLQQKVNELTLKLTSMDTSR